RSLLRKELARLTRLEESELAQLASQPEPAASTAPPPDPDSDGPPPWLDAERAWPELPSQRSRRRAAPPPQESRRRLRLSLVERLILILIQHPSVLARQPLPARVEELAEPQMDVLVQLLDLLTEQPDLPGPALLGALMA